MAKKINMSRIELGGVDSFFSVRPEEIIHADITKIRPFENHPFQVREDADMEELVRSIRENGILEAAIVRRDGDGYELISGHRRKRACEIIGIGQMPCRVVDVSDDEATVYMVDANLRREKILPSEKAKAYRMKHDALKHQGKENGGSLSVGQMSLESGDSASQIKRYIRLTYLSDGLLDMVDEEKIPFSVAVPLSFLDDKDQSDLYALLLSGLPVPSGEVADFLKRKSQEGDLNKKIIAAILTGDYTEGGHIPFVQESGSLTAGGNDEERDGGSMELRSKLDRSEKTGQTKFPDKLAMKATDVIPDKTDEEPLQGQMEIGDYPDTLPEEIPQPGDAAEDDFVSRVKEVCSEALRTAGFRFEKDERPGDSCLYIYDKEHNLQINFISLPWKWKRS